MLVYGDRSERVDPGQFLGWLEHESATLQALPAGSERHSRLVALLIEAGRLSQGIADERFERERQDRRSAQCDALASYLVQLAQAVIASWQADRGAVQSIPRPPPLARLPRSVELREPEGFAFYAVYPEAYCAAARRLQLRGPARIIGIRSIGTSLGAIVAAALGARVFYTVRPVGDPFARIIAVSAELETELLAGAAHYVVVDEGPGQSGSSFGAVADWLQERGVPIDRIAFVPSHGGEPGPQSSDAHRGLWRDVQRSPAAFEAGPLATRFGPLEQLRNGERLKFLGREGGHRVLLKFAGLGQIGTRKLAMARKLHAAGWTAEPLGLVHGFLVERWHGEAEPLRTGDRPLPAIAAYLALRARLFPSAQGEGAGIEELFAMACRNAALGIGAEAAATLERWRPRLRCLGERMARVRTDNRLDPDKWRRLPDGRLLKTDAVDHHAAHDLIGAQDIAWDVAGAAVEFDLDAVETSRLAAGVGRASGRLVDPELLEFMTIAYLSFRLGKARILADASTGNPSVQQWLASEAGRYSSRLRKLLLDGSRVATRANPASVPVRNEPPREQSFRNRVEEEEAVDKYNIS